jgi:hypothetical protein
MPDDMTLAHHVRTQLCLTVECKFDKGCGCLDAIASAIKAAEARGLRRAAALHESINPASDEERQRGDPGAGAMRAVIAYRDAILDLIPPPAEDRG